MILSSAVIGHRRALFAALLLPLLSTPLLAGCSSEPNANLPGNLQDGQPFSAIAEDDAISLIGTEPFWGGSVSDGLFTYSTPDDIDGQRLAVTRFAGRGGLSFSGETGAGNPQAVDLAITPAPCSDGMSDRTYPFTVTLQWGDDLRIGCGWSDAQPFEGEPQP